MYTNLNLYDIDLPLTKNEIKNLTLVEIENTMRKFGKSLRDYEAMSFPDMSSASSMQNKLIHDELSYDRVALGKEHKHLVANLTDEQHYVYDMVMDAVDSRCGGVFFVYGYGSTRKYSYGRHCLRRLGRGGNCSERGFEWHNFTFTSQWPNCLFEIFNPSESK